MVGGWLQVLGNVPQHPQAVEEFGGPSLMRQDEKSARVALSTQILASREDSKPPSWGSVLGRLDRPLPNLYL